MNIRQSRLGLAAFAGTALLGGPAYAEETRCTGTLGAERLDNIFVPDGSTCTLNGTRLNGNIVVGTGATLSASGVIVNGNLQAEGATQVFVNPGSRFGGSVQIKQGGGARIVGAFVSGDIQLESNARRLVVRDSDVGGNMQVKQNTGGVVLRNNEIESALQCSANSPAPTGGGNIAGDKEDQCASL